MRCPSRFIGLEFKRSAAGENTHRRTANQKSKTEIKNGNQQTGINK
jgi:hypothetical protein